MPIRTRGSRESLPAPQGNRPRKKPRHTNPTSSDDTIGDKRSPAAEEREVAVANEPRDDEQAALCDGEVPSGGEVMPPSGEAMPSLDGGASHCGEVQAADVAVLTPGSGESEAVDIKGEAWDSLQQLESLGYYIDPPSDNKAPIWKYWRLLSSNHPKYEERSNSGQFQCILKPHGFSEGFRPVEMVGKDTCADPIDGKIYWARKVGKWYRGSNLVKYTQRVHKKLTEKKAAIIAEDIDAVVNAASASTNVSSTPRNSSSIDSRFKEIIRKKKQKDCTVAMMQVRKRKSSLLLCAAIMCLHFFISFFSKVYCVQ